MSTLLYPATWKMKQGSLTPSSFLIFRNMAWVMEWLEITLFLLKGSGFCGFRLLWLALQYPSLLLASADWIRGSPWAAHSSWWAQPIRVSILSSRGEDSGVGIWGKGQVLGLAEKFGFSHTILQKSANEVFSQPNRMGVGINARTNPSHMQIGNGGGGVVRWAGEAE